MPDIKNRFSRRAPWAVAAAFSLLASSAYADCPPSCGITGGGDETTDCFTELAGLMQLNSPFPNPAKPKDAKEHRCFDGEAGCDLDGEVNGSCEFDLDLCLRNADPNLPSCAPIDVDEVSIKGSTTKFPELATLQTSVNGLLPATTNVCTSGNSVVVPLKVTGKGIQKRSKFSVKVVTKAGGSSDKDKAKFSCIPHRWPSQSYSYKNQRSTTQETTITPANVSQLFQKWNFATDGGVTGTPTVGRKNVYIASWDGNVYALDRKSGKVKWQYDTGADGTFSGVPGVQASVTLTADGRALVGDGFGTVHALDTKKGDLLWTASLGDPDETTGVAAHAWGSPTVANGRVFVGRSSHDDGPCTQGHLYAFDLDTGTELWRTATVPDAICDNDTTIECSTNGDCGGGTCVPGIGGGVTTTPATSPDGETVYMVTVGCLSSPLIGNSDSIFALDAATGAIDWVHNTHANEQFSDGPPYQDYGFLNGPILADIDDGIGGTIDALIAGSKDGSIYVLDRLTGVPVYVQEVMPAEEFAEFGTFNAAMAYQDGRIFATLFDQSLGAPTTGVDRMRAFSATDGSDIWGDREDVLSWADTSVANGMVFVGGPALGSGRLSAYDAATGALLDDIVGGIGGAVGGGPSIVDGIVYLPYGITGTGGVIAYRLP